MDSFIQEKRLELKALRAQYRQATKELYDFQANYTIGLISKLKENNLIYITCNHEQTEIVSLGVEGLRKKEDYHCVSCKNDLIQVNLAGQKFLMTQAEYNIVNELKNTKEHKSIYESWIPNASPKTVKMLKERQSLYKKYQDVQNEMIQRIVDGLKKSGMISSSCEHEWTDAKTRKCTKCNRYLDIVSVGNQEDTKDFILVIMEEDRKVHDIARSIPELYGQYGYNNIDSRFGDEQ